MQAAEHSSPLMTHQTGFRTLRACNSLFGPQGRGISRRGLATFQRLLVVKHEPVRKWKVWIPCISASKFSKPHRIEGSSLYLGKWASRCSRKSVTDGRFLLASNRHLAAERDNLVCLDWAEDFVRLKAVVKGQRFYWRGLWLAPIAPSSWPPRLAYHSCNLSAMQLSVSLLLVMSI